MLNLTSVMEELELIGVSLMENFIELPEEIILGIDSYVRFMAEMQSVYPYEFNSFQMNLSCGSATVKVSKQVPPTYVGIGRFTSSTTNLLRTLRRLNLPKTNYPYFLL